MKTFSTLPFEEDEVCTNLAAFNSGVVITTNKGNSFMVDEKGIAKRIVFVDKPIAVNFFGEEWKEDRPIEQEGDA